MNPGAKFGVTYLIVLGLFVRFVCPMFVQGSYVVDLVSSAILGLIAWILAIKMNQLRHNPGEKYKLGILGIGEMLGPSDRHHLFWFYIVSALLFSLSSLYGAYQLSLK